MKTCSVCEIEKPITEFHRVNTRGKNQPLAHCKVCQAEKDKNPRYRYSRARAISRRYGVEFEITRDEYVALVSKPCYYCGDSIAESSGKAMDRIDRTRGYTLDNLVPCCWLCNHVKGATFDAREMKEVAALFAGFKARRASEKLPPLEAPVGGKKSKPRTPKYWQAPENRKKGWEYMWEGQVAKKKDADND